jgi:hypothetical protein
MEPDDREALIDILNRSGVDYDASEKDTVLVETSVEGTFAEFVFGDPGPLRAVNLYTPLRGAYRA